MKQCNLTKSSCRKFLLMLSLLVFILFGCGEKTAENQPVRIDAPSLSTTDYETMPSESETAPSETASIETTDADTSDSDVPDEIAAQTAVLLDNMPLEDKIGQLILARMPADDDTAVAYCETYKVGGYVLFASDFENKTPQSIRYKIKNLTKITSWPMFFAVDEEGGTVTRISRYSQYRDAKFASPRELMAGGIEAVSADTEEKCQLLKSLWLNFNLAPVADISEDSSEFIYYRSAGGLENAVEYVRAYVLKSSELSVGSTLKHFPGYGGNADTHTGAAYDDRDLDELMSRDLVPFIEGIEAGADAVMVSHNTIECLDHDNPASLSPAVHELLRDELGFDGIIMTDDLAMGAVTDRYDSSEAAVMSILAGNDLVCCSDLPASYQGLYEAALDGRLTEERITESVKRIIRCKIKLGIIDINIDINTEER